ncbi:MAG: hypothetical protein M3P12_07340 [Gemmatimonadota bacterium]|nr:hypothetical protein [Gemmatimonadota bacterium]
MIRSRFLRSLAIVLMVTVAISCTDNSPTGPSAPVNAQNGVLSGIFDGLLGGDKSTPISTVVGFIADATGIDIYPVRWNADRPRVSYTVTGTIGRAGGTLVIPQTDFSIAFPAGAVSSPVTMRITSDPEFVSYKMDPHGLKFAKPVTVTQKLRYTTVYGVPLTSELFAAYLADDSLDLSIIIHALEIIQSTTIFQSGSSTLPETSVWSINHFSRYILASG